MVKTEISDQTIKSAVCGMLSDVLGFKLAEMYRQFYDSKDLSTVFVSAQELLAEAVGEQKAKEMVEGIKRQYEL